MNKILITEDDPFVARIYQTRFQAEGFEEGVGSLGSAGVGSGKDFGVRDDHALLAVTGAFGELEKACQFLRLDRAA